MRLAFYFLYRTCHRFFISSASCCFFLCRVFLCFLSPIPHILHSSFAAYHYISPAFLYELKRLCLLPVSSGVLLVKLSALSVLKPQIPGAKPRGSCLVPHTEATTERQLHNGSHSFIGPSDIFEDLILTPQLPLLLPSAKPSMEMARASRRSLGDTLNLISWSPHFWTCSLLQPEGKRWPLSPYGVHLKNL